MKFNFDFNTHSIELYILRFWEFVVEKIWTTIKGVQDLIVFFFIL